MKSKQERTLPSVDENGLVKEGRAQISVGEGLNTNEVFYNPVQVFNRDLSIIAIRAFAQIREKEEQLKYTARCNKLKGQQEEHGACHSVAQFTSKECEETQDIVSGGSKDDQVSVRLKILEPLAATGLRSIRYALELEDVTDILVAGDLDVAAVRMMDSNRERNGIHKEKLRVVCSDANQLMHFCHYGGINISKAFILPSLNSDSSSTATMIHGLLDPFIGNLSMCPKKLSHFDVIDIDPYGSAAGFLDAAVQSVADGGMICITSTDMPILCGNNPEVSFYKYGGTAVKARYAHEMSLRLLINAVAIAAARHKRVVEPLLSCSVDFYIRCFVRIRSRPVDCKLLASRSSIALQCTNCDAFTTIPLGIVEPKSEVTGDDASKYKYKVPQMPPNLESECLQCGNKRGMWIAGPFYSSSLYNREFVDLCLSLTSGNIENGPLESLTMITKIRGLLIAISEEDWYSPLYYHLPSLMNRIKVEMIKTTKFKSALLHLGYRVSHFHREPQSIKTNAPAQVVFDILRKWAEEHPPKIPEKYGILSKPIITSAPINFELHFDATSKSSDVCKWLPNPIPYWGPKARARAKRSTEPIEQDQPKNKKLKT